MRSILVTGACAVLVLTAVACGGDATGPADLSACAGDDFAALDDWSDAGFSGSIVVAAEQELRCSAAAGLADDVADRRNTAATVFAIGSVSKAMTAQAVLDLIADGSLSVDDRAGSLVAGLSGPAAGATIGQLLLHTSGLAGSIGADHEPLSRDDAVAALSQLATVASSDKRFEYTNAGYTLLALIVEEVTGTDYRSFLADQVLVDASGRRLGGFWDGDQAPGRDRAVGYLPDGHTGADGRFDGPHWALTGNGDVAMSMTDLARWTGEAFAPDGEAELSLEFDVDGAQAVLPGWVRFDDSVFGATVFAAAGGGGDVGHDVAVAWIPDSQTVVAIASNRPSITAEDLLQAILPSLVAGEAIPSPAGDVSDFDADELTEFLGSYELPGGERIDVSAADRGLAVRPDGPEGVAVLFPRPSGSALDEMVAHESAVQNLLKGATPAGTAELEALEDDIGAIQRVAELGTVVDDGELRTYVAITAGQGQHVVAWYALDDEGVIQAVELGTQLPALLVAPVDDANFRPVDPTGSGLDVTIEFGESTMTIDNGVATVIATRA